MSTYEVDPAGMEAVARTLRTLTEEMRQAGHRTARALELAGSAAGSGATAATGVEAGQRWQTGLDGYAEGGLALSRATEQAAQAYRAAEWASRSALAPVVP